MARETDKPPPPDIERKKASAREVRALAAEKDRQVRIRSVANDTRLQLPVSIGMPDGEEYPGTTTQLRIRSYDQRAEIQKGYIQGPPNRTICDAPEWIDWEPSDVRRSRDGKHSSSNSSSSKVQLWGLKLTSSSSTSGKSPPSHTSRPSRHSHQGNNTKIPPFSSSSSSKHKNSSSSSSSSPCSSTSSSTSSCTGLGGILTAATTTATTAPTKSDQSFSEKLVTVFTERSGGSGRGNRSRTSPNNNSPSPSPAGLCDKQQGDGQHRQTQAQKQTFSKNCFEFR